MLCNLENLYCTEGSVINRRRRKPRRAYLCYMKMKNSSSRCDLHEWAYLLTTHIKTNLQHGGGQAEIWHMLLKLVLFHSTIIYCGYCLVGTITVCVTSFLTNCTLQLSRAHGSDGICGVTILVVGHNPMSRRFSASFKKTTASIQYCMTATARYENTNIIGFSVSLFRCIAQLPNDPCVCVSKYLLLRSSVCFKVLFFC